MQLTIEWTESLSWAEDSLNSKCNKGGEVSYPAFKTLGTERFAQARSFCRSLSGRCPKARRPEGKQSKPDGH